MHRTTQTQNLHFDLYGLATWDDLDLTRGQGRLWMVIKSTVDTIHTVSSALLQPDMAILTGEASNGR